MLCPEAMADDGDGTIRTTGGLIVGVVEGAAENGFHTQSGKIFAAGECTVDMDYVGAPAHLDLRIAPGEETGEGTAVFLKRLEEWVSHGYQRPPAKPLNADGAQLLGVRHRQRLQQQCVDQAEDGRIGPDPEGEREN